MDAAMLDVGSRASLRAYLLAWADDELILGHRDSEWTGFAPMIEEDVAFSSIAQDEIGHAALLYRLAADLTDPPDDPDRLALRRPAHAYRHAPLLERPNGDWAFTIARHYLYDLADAARTAALAESAHAALAACAGKMAREEHYHLLHGAAWWERLTSDPSPSGKGEPAGAARGATTRLIAALRAVLPLAVDLFGATPDQDALIDAGIAPDPASLLGAWRAQVRELIVPLDPSLLPLLERERAPRLERDISADFAALHAEMTMVAASGMGERW